MFPQSPFSPVCFAFLWLLLRFLCILISSRVIQGRWILALMFRRSMLLLIKVVRHSQKRSSLCLYPVSWGPRRSTHNLVCLCRL